MGDYEYWDRINPDSGKVSHEISRDEEPEDGETSDEAEDEKREQQNFQVQEPLERDPGIKEPDPSDLEAKDSVRIFGPQLDEADSRFQEAASGLMMKDNETSVVENSERFIPEAFRDTFDTYQEYVAEFVAGYQDRDIGEEHIEELDSSLRKIGVALDEEIDECLDSIYTNIQVIDELFEGLGEASNHMPLAEPVSNNREAARDYKEIQEKIDFLVEDSLAGLENSYRRLSERINFLGQIRDTVEEVQAQYEREQNKTLKNIMPGAETEELPSPDEPVETVNMMMDSARKGLEELYRMTGSTLSQLVEQKIDSYGVRSYVDTSGSFEERGQEGYMKIPEMIRRLDDID